MASAVHAGTVVAARPAHALALRRGGLRLTRYAVMLVLAVFFLLPYVWMVSGSLPGKAFPNNEPGPSLYCAVIVKTVDAQTRAKTSINELLRSVE